MTGWRRMLWNIVKPAIMSIVRGAVREKLDKINELDDFEGIKDRIAEAVQEKLGEL